MKLQRTYNVLESENELRKFVQYLTRTGYTFHHSAKAFGYVGKKHTALYEEYSGVFGSGVVIHYPTDKTCKSSSNHRIDYYIYTSWED